MTDVTWTNTATRFRDRARRTNPRTNLTPGRMTVRGYARCIGATEPTIRLWITQGMPAYRVGTHWELHPDEADAWVQEHRADSVAMFRSGVVYFAERPDGAIKIGYSSDAAQRMSTLKFNGRRARARLVISVPGDLGLEDLLHDVFADECIGGEWFRGDGALRVFLDKLVAGRRAKQAPTERPAA